MCLSELYSLFVSRSLKPFLSTLTLWLNIEGSEDCRPGVAVFGARLVLQKVTSVAADLRQSNVNIIVEVHFSKLLQLVIHY